MDRLNELEGDLIRTRTMEQAGVDAWRVPVPTDMTGDHRVCYLPFMGCQFGVRGGCLPVRKLLDAFTWHARRGTVEHMVMMPSCGPLPIQSHTWPSYGFDEFFMTVAAYPRLAQGGMLTFVPTTARSQLLALDVEYVTWGNPRSELVYFAAGSCCGSPLWEDVKTEIVEMPPLNVAEDEKDETSRGPSEALPTVIGLLFLTRGDSNHPEIWREWINDDGSRCRVSAHPKEPETISDDSFLKEGVIDEQVATGWGSVSLIRATLALLRSGLADSDCTHFALLSESCIPVRPLADILRALTLDPRSRIRVTPWEEVRKRDLLKAQRVEKIRGIRKEVAHFQDQWMILSREDAEYFVANDRTEAFEEVFAPDESYFATVLAAGGRSPLVHCANRSVTWADWERESPHPKGFLEVSARDAARMAESGCFFARKFPKGSDIGRYGLHRGVAGAK